MFNRQRSTINEKGKCSIRNAQQSMFNKQREREMLNSQHSIINAQQATRRGNAQSTTLNNQCSTRIAPSSCFAVLFTCALSAGSWALSISASSSPAQDPPGNGRMFNRQRSTINEKGKCSIHNTQQSMLNKNRTLFLFRRSLHLRVECWVLGIEHFSIFLARSKSSGKSISTHGRSPMSTGYNCMPS